MTSYRPRAWHIVFIVLFGAFELVVFWLATHPNVADDYRAYYIDRTASCFPREDRIASGVYALGTPISFVPDRNGHTDDNLRWCGLIAPTKQSPFGIKSFGDYGVLKLRFAVPDEDLQLTFAAYANANAKDPAREVKVVANGQEIGSVTFTDAKRVEGMMTIPAAVAKANTAGGVDLKFEVPRIGPPGTNSEPVTLQLRLQAVRLVEASKVPPPPTTLIARPGVVIAKK